MSQNMSAAQFMSEGTKASYPSVVFQQTGATFVGKVIGDPEVVWTKDDEDDDEKTPKLVVNMRCTAVGGNITTKVKVPGVGEQEVLPTVGEMYSFWLKKRTSMLRAVNDAVMGQGVSTGVPQDQGDLALQMTGIGERTNPKYNPPKLFAAEYKAAPAGIEAANLLGMGVQNAPQAPAQPQYAPQPQMAPQQPMAPQYAPQPPMQPMAPQQPMMPQPQPAPQQPGFGNLLG